MPPVQKETALALSGPENHPKLLADDDTSLDSDFYIDSLEASKIDPRPNRKNPTYTAYLDVFLEQHSPEDMYEYDLRMWKLRNAKLLAEQSYSKTIKIQQRGKKRKVSEVKSDEEMERKRKRKFAREREKRDVDESHKKTSEAPWAWYGSAESFRGRKQTTKAPRQQYEERGVSSMEEIRAATHPNGEGLEILRAAGALMSMSRRNQKMAAETLPEVNCTDSGMGKSLQVGSRQKVTPQTVLADPKRAYNEAIARKLNKRDNVDNNDWLDQRVVYTCLDPVGIDDFIAYIKAKVNKHAYERTRSESKAVATDERRPRLFEPSVPNPGEEPADIQSGRKRHISIVKLQSGSEEREIRRGVANTKKAQCWTAEKKALPRTQSSTSGRAPAFALVATANVTSAVQHTERENRPTVEDQFRKVEWLAQDKAGESAEKPSRMLRIRKI